MSLSRVSSRVASVNESATLSIDATAKKMLADGVDVVSFAAGEPDFATPEFIVDAAVSAAKDSRNHHYTPAAGLAELRSVIAQVTVRDSGLDVSPSQVIVTNGGKHAIYEAIISLIDDGDEVLIPAPYWVSYPEIVRLAGGVPVPVPTSLETGFKVTPAMLEPFLTDRTKALIHVSPSNPTGAVYTRDETEVLARFLDESGLFVISDEIYQHLTYTTPQAPTIGEVAPRSLIERIVLVNGVAKTYAMTGWRVGWVVAPADIAAGVARLQSQMNSNVANVSQRAALAALSSDPSATAWMRETFRRRRQLIVNALGMIEGIDIVWPDGAFYAFPRVSGLFGMRYGDRLISSSFDLAEVLLTEAKVAVIPGEAFDGPGYLRMSYALGDDDLVRGVERIAELVGRLKEG
ncbi:MAG: pyridoxal phosphate-dependent aminotransferase [Ferrimicrobium sp.]